MLHLQIDGLDAVIEQKVGCVLARAHLAASCYPQTATGSTDRNAPVFQLLGRRWPGAPVGLLGNAWTVTRSEPPETVWLHDCVGVRPSPIEGKGLFATGDLAAGIVVMRLGGRLVSTAELTALLDAAASDPAGLYIDTITVYQDAHLVLPAGGAAHFGNHSCDPNLWHAGPYDLVSRRDIHAGEELTIDYATNSGLPNFTMTCQCGSKLCRGTITGEDWRRVELRNRYGNHWVPALQDRLGYQ